MLYTQKEFDDELGRQLDKLLREIVKNNPTCQKCAFHRPEIYGEGGCFLSFKCVQQGFEGFKEEE